MCKHTVFHVTTTYVDGWFAEDASLMSCCLILQQVHCSHWNRCIATGARGNMWLYYITVPPATRCALLINTLCCAPVSLNAVAPILPDRISSLECTTPQEAIHQNCVGAWCRFWVSRTCSQSTAWYVEFLWRWQELLYVRSCLKPYYAVYKFPHIVCTGILRFYDSKRSHNRYCHRPRRPWHGGRMLVKKQGHWTGITLLWRLMQSRVSPVKEIVCQFDSMLIIVLHRLGY